MQGLLIVLLLLLCQSSFHLKRKKIRQYDASLAYACVKNPASENTSRDAKYKQTNKRKTEQTIMY